MKILYAATLSPNDSALYRLWALRRLGHTVIPLDALDYIPGNPFLAKLAFRAVLGPHVARLNRDLLRLAQAEQPHLLWADKLLSLQPETLQALRCRGIFTLDYTIDNPFGPRNDPGWRLFRKNIPLFDLHVVQRSQNLLDYRRAGARDVLKIQTASEPTLHFPPPPGWSDRDRIRAVSFIGNPYDDRARFLTRLATGFQVPLTISGNRIWRRALSPAAAAALYRPEGELFRNRYREAIWQSKINLSFITHSNRDEFAHKSFEIAACGGFLLAERSPGHLERFAEGREAVFFSTIEECAAHIRRFLPDEAARTAIAEAGRLRAQRDGYTNDHQVALILKRVQETRPKQRPR